MTANQNQPELLPCPCGQTPTSIQVYEGGNSSKYAFASPICCGEWLIEFNTGYTSGDELQARAVKAWQGADRAATAQAKGGVPDEELTRIYNDANGITGGKNPPISTERIFTAMRATYARAIEQHTAQATPAGEGVGLPVVGWLFTDDPEIYAPPGSGFHVGAEKPHHAINLQPLTDHATATAEIAKRDAEITRYIGEYNKFTPWLKPGETPFERLNRERKDNIAVTGLLAKATEELATLRAQLAEAQKDAESWRAYQKRKQEVIAAGMGKNPLRDAAMQAEGVDG